MNSIRIQADHSDRLIFDHDGIVVAEYVFAPTEPQVESPRPYFSPLRTLGGREVTSYRPADHVWHKGLSLALPVVDGENFWGGPSYLRDRGYVQLPNNGAQLHTGFTAVEVEDCAAITESLEWVTQSGTTVFAETRRLTATVNDKLAWTLTFETSLRNLTSDPVSLGSPTTRGRADAGYGGLFWRGPHSFGGCGGVVHAPSRAAAIDGDSSGANHVADELRGSREAWMSFSGRHDDGTGTGTEAETKVAAAAASATAAGKAGGTGTSGGSATATASSCAAEMDSHPEAEAGAWSTVVMIDDVTNPGYPNEWFVRSTEYACLGPAPFFSAEVSVDPGEVLTLRYAIVIADGCADAARAQSLAAAGQLTLDILAQATQTQNLAPASASAPAASEFPTRAPSSTEAQTASPTPSACPPPTTPTPPPTPPPTSPSLTRGVS